MGNAPTVDASDHEATATGGNRCKADAFRREGLRLGLRPGLHNSRRD
jgi:hypothetical protein